MAVNRIRKESTAQFGEAPSATQAEHILLTIIVPVYNEAKTVDELLQQVLFAPYKKQVVVVDDGSTDGTVEVLERWEGHPEVELMRHTHNRGKGAAIRTGLDHAKGEYTIIQDADLEYDPQDYPRLIEPLRHGAAQIVYGSRYLNRDAHEFGHRRWSLFRLGVSVLNLVVRVLYRARITDEATCHKALPTSLLRAMDLQCERFEFCPEVTAKALRLGLTIHEVPIHYDPRSVKAGKKIGWRDGVEAVMTLIRWRFASFRPRVYKQTTLGSGEFKSRQDRLPPAETSVRNANYQKSTISIDSVSAVSAIR